MRHHNTVTETKMAENTGLKKLSFVPENITKGYTIASNVYTTAKSYVPAPLQTHLSRVEETVTAVSAPYISKAQDKGTELLKAVDERVRAPRGPAPRWLLARRILDGPAAAARWLQAPARPFELTSPPSPPAPQVESAVQGAGQVYQSNTAYLSSQLEKQKAFHHSNMESYKAAREQYLKRVEDSVEFVRANGVTGAAKRAADEVAAAVGEARKLPGLVLQRVHDAFDRLAALEPVHKALATARPAVDAAYQRYDSLHAAVVRSPSYRRAYDLGTSAVARAQETSVFRAAKDSLYPLVAKFADPALETVAASPYYQAALAHIAPVATVAAPQA